MVKIIDKKRTENTYRYILENKCLNNKNELFKLNLHSVFVCLLLSNCYWSYVTLKVSFGLFFASLWIVVFLDDVF